MDLAQRFRQAEAIDFCRRWKVAELALFGSIARGEARAGSDVDLLVTFLPGAEWTLLDHMAMQRELETMLGHPVDLVSRSAVDRSPNPYRRTAILNSARTVYAA